LAAAASLGLLERLSPPAFAQAISVGESHRQSRRVDNWTAVEVVEHIRSGEITAEAYCQQAVEAYRDQKQINAITWFDETRVMEAARAIDKARVAGRALGPLAGLPFVAKDNIDTVGFPSTAGTPALGNCRPKANAPVIEALLAQGAILFGKTNMHELASGGTTNNPTWGPTRNPYNLNHVPGGSSGGTAAAIAARIVPAGLGSDSLGSTRIPASFCGIAGMRPSLVPSTVYAAGGLVPVLPRLDTAGPMARTLADVAVIHAAITGRPAAKVGPLRGVRLGIPRQFYWDDVDPEVSRVVRDALNKLREAGAVLVDIDVSGILEGNSIYFSLSDMRAEVGNWLATHCPSVTLDDLVAGIKGDVVKAIWVADSASPASIKAALEVRDRLIIAYRTLFEAHGIAAMAYPTTIVTAMPIRSAGDSWNDALDVNGKSIPERFITIRNAAATGVYNAPGISLPAGLSRQGLPVGLDLDGPASGDDALLALGREVEAVLGVLPPPP
jgi:mandelamide amidase